MLNNKNNQITANSPVIFEHKRPVLQYDRPLLEQRDRIEELRHALNGQRPERVVPVGQRLTPEEEKQVRLGQFNSQLLPTNHGQQPILFLGQSSPTNGIVSDKNQLMQQLNNLALQPLINQSPVQQPADKQQALLLGQRQRQQPQLTQQHHTSSWRSGQHNVQPEDNQNGNGQHQVAKRHEGNHFSPNFKLFSTHREVYNFVGPIPTLASDLERLIIWGFSLESLSPCGSGWRNILKLSPRKIEEIVNNLG